MEPLRVTTKERTTKPQQKVPRMREQGNMKDQEVCINCAMLAGSSCGTEKAYIEQYREDSDVFLENEHRMKGEEAEPQNKLARINLKIAVDEARDTEGSTGQGAKNHTPGGVSIAVDGPWSSVVSREKAAARMVPCNEGRSV